MPHAQPSSALYAVYCTNLHDEHQQQEQFEFYRRIHALLDTPMVHIGKDGTIT